MLHKCGFTCIFIHYFDSLSFQSSALVLCSVFNASLQVVHLETWLIELVPFLATNITEGTMGDESLLLALQILANLCRSSPVVVVDCLRHLPNNKVVCRKLESVYT